MNPGTLNMFGGLSEIAKWSKAILSPVVRLVDEESESESELIGGRGGERSPLLLPR